MKNRLRYMLVLIVAVAMLLTVSVNPVYCDAVDDKWATFNSAYEQVNLGGDTALEQTALKDACLAGEYLFDNDLVESSNLNFNTQYSRLLKAYKESVKINVSENYHPNDYSDTENGARKLTSQKQSCETAIASANTVAEVDSAYSEYIALIESNTLAKNVKTITTKSDAPIQATVVCDEFIFSTDDVLVVKEVKQSVRAKNFNWAIKNSEDRTIEKGGIGFYFEIKLFHNNACTEIKDKNLTVSIDVSSLELPEDSKVQVAKYLYNQKCELYPESTVENNVVTFNVSSFDEYAVVVKDAEPEYSSQLIWFVVTYKVYIILGVIAVLIIVLPITYSRKLKKKKAKQNGKAYKAYLKEYKKNKNKNNKDE